MSFLPTIVFERRRLRPEYLLVSRRQIQDLNLWLL